MRTSARRMGRSDARRCRIGNQLFFVYGKVPFVFPGGIRSDILARLRGRLHRGQDIGGMIFLSRHARVSTSWLWNATRLRHTDDFTSSFTSFSARPASFSSTALEMRSLFCLFLFVL